MVFGRKFRAQHALSCILLAALPVLATAQEPPKPAQEPNTQVQTGSVLGNGTAGLFSRLAALFRDHQILEAEKLIDDAEEATAAGKPAPLNPQQTQLYRGVLANRENKPEDSIRLLEPLLAQLKSSGNPPEEKLLRKTLAEDYLRAGQYAKANQAYLEYEYRFGGAMTPDEKAEIELPVHLLPLAIANPPMTVEPGEPFALPYDRDALGLTDVPVFVDAQSHDWMLDPTLPFNLICKSTARQVGLKISEQTATIQALTGRPIQVHMTVIPRFTLGTVTFRNMTAFVFDDADYYFPKSNYQVRGVLGYPAVSALGSLTVTEESKIEVQPGARGERLTAGARFFLDGDQIVAALGKPGSERMFIVDAGGQQTYMTSRYYSEHSGDFSDKKMQLLAMPGAHKRPPAPAYVAESLTLFAGDAPLTLHYIQVLTEPLDAAAIDDSYGTLGTDALDELKSYTFDYRTMRFGVKNE